MHIPRPSPNNWFSTAGLAVSPDGTLIAACESSDRYQLGLAENYGMLIWDAKTGDIVRRISVSAHGPIAWHPEGTALAIAGARHITIVSPEGELLWNLIGHELPRGGIANIWDVAYSPDGTQLASTSSDGTVRLWAMGGDECSAGHVLEMGRRSNAAVSYSPDGSYLAVGSTSSYGEGDPENPPELWDPVTGDRHTVLNDVKGVVFEISYCTDGVLLALTHEPSALLVIDADGTISNGPVPNTTTFADLVVGPGSKVAVLSSGGELLIWDRSTGEETRLAETTVDRVCWSADESVLYGLSSSAGLSAWDGETWTPFELP